MEPRSLLLARIDALKRELIQVEDAVNSPKLDEDLRGRVGPWFDLELSRQKLQVEELHKEAANQDSLDTCWAKFRTRENKIQELFDECLAFIQGALARTANVDQGICNLADRLLEDLSHWSKVDWNLFTLLAPEEFFGDVAEIIRVRFPETSIWSLPLAAHEFGHFLGPELRKKGAGDDEYPFRKMLKIADNYLSEDSLVPHSEEWHHLHEHFADLFATLALGPAYACSFILLRLNPVDAYQEPPTHTHPSHAKRVHSILWKLTKMDDKAEDPSKPYGFIIESLRQSWNESLKDIGLPENLLDVEVSLLEERLKRLDDVLTKHTPSKLGYQTADWNRAKALATKLHPDKPWSSPNPTPELTRRDVLNAAWICRLTQKKQVAYQLNDINNRAVDLYQRIAPTV